MMYEFENDFPLVIYCTDGDTLTGIKQVIDKLNELDHDAYKYKKIIEIMKVVTQEICSYPSEMFQELLNREVFEFEDYISENFDNDQISIILEAIQ